MPRPNWIKGGESVDVLYIGVFGDVATHKYYPVEIEVITINPIRARITRRYDGYSDLWMAWHWLLNTLAEMLPEHDIHLFSNTLTGKEVIS